MTSWSCPPAAAKFSQRVFFQVHSPKSWALRSITIDLIMENQPLLEDHSHGPLTRKGNGNGLLPPGRQYMDMPFQEVFEEPGPGPLHEYWQIIRRRKGTVILIVSLGFLISLLLTIPQTPVYQARGSIEIQNLNENFLNTRNVSPTADGEASDAPGTDLQTQAKILQSDSLLERVIAKLDLGKRLFPEEGSSRIALWRKALGLAGSAHELSREQMLRLLAKNLKITNDPNTRLVEIRYDSTDPRLAA